MRLVLSRKGVDSAAGGCASPVVDGRCVSLPIPYRGSPVTYGAAGYGDLIAKATRGRLGPQDACHQDPEFRGGRVAFGQIGAALTHLERQGVGVGDLFLFFGRFREEDGTEAHRIYGWMQVEEVRDLGSRPAPASLLGGPFAHPHTVGEWPRRNVVYLGRGTDRAPAHPALRLTAPGERLTSWRVPDWLADRGLTYHGRSDRWPGPGRLTAVAQGQEFVTDLTGFDPGLAWVETILDLIGRPAPRAAASAQPIQEFQ